MSLLLPAKVRTSLSLFALDWVSEINSRTRGNFRRKFSINCCASPMEIFSAPARVLAPEFEGKGEGGGRGEGVEERGGDRGEGREREMGEGRGERGEGRGKR
jgi:hypothetical protein